eukprot:3552652-Amphidinium_carterae.1
MVHQAMLAGWSGNATQPIVCLQSPIGQAQPMSRNKSRRISPITEVSSAERTPWHTLFSSCIGRD